MLQPAYAPKEYREAELIEAIIQNKVEAIDHLYDLYAGTLYGSIFNSIKDNKKAAEILQIVFIRIYKEIEGYNFSKKRLFTWMLSITRDETLAAISSNNYLNNNATVECNSVMCMGEINPYLHSGIPHIKKATGQLKPRDKVLIELRYYYGYTHDEIAGLLKIPLASVKPGMKRAMEKLQRLLTKE